MCAIHRGDFLVAKLLAQAHHCEIDQINFMLCEAVGQLPALYRRSSPETFFL